MAAHEKQKSEVDVEGADCEEEGGVWFSLRKRERRRELALFGRTSGTTTLPFPKFPAASRTWEICHLFLPRPF